jgi:hypothetical protein
MSWQLSFHEETIFSIDCSTELLVSDAAARIGEGSIEFSRVWSFNEFFFQEVLLFSVSENICNCVVAF